MSICDNATFEQCRKRREKTQQFLALQYAIARHELLLYLDLTNLNEEGTHRDEEDKELFKFLKCAQTTNLGFDLAENVYRGAIARLRKAETLRETYRIDTPERSALLRVAQEHSIAI